jgi:hypothetical protein
VLVVQPGPQPGRLGPERAQVAGRPPRSPTAGAVGPGAGAGGEAGTRTGGDRPRVGGAGQGGRAGEGGGGEQGGREDGHGARPRGPAEATARGRAGDGWRHGTSGLADVRCSLDTGSLPGAGRMGP